MKNQLKLFEMGKFWGKYTSQLTKVDEANVIKIVLIAIVANQVIWIN